MDNVVGPNSSVASKNEPTYDQITSMGSEVEGLAYTNKASTVMVFPDIVYTTKNIR